MGDKYTGPSMQVNQHILFKISCSEAKYFQFSEAEKCLAIQGKAVKTTFST